MIPIDQGGGGNTCHRSRFPLRKMTLFATNLAFFLLLGFLLFSPIAFAGNPRGTLVHDETIRVAPANDAAKLGQAERGHELVILDSSRDWTHVEAILVEPKKDADTEEEAEGKIITGWVPSRALVEMSNPNGDKIIFGEAADSEDQASRRLGRRNAAQDKSGALHSSGARLPQVLRQRLGYGNARVTGKAGGEVREQGAGDPGRAAALVSQLRNT